MNIVDSIANGVENLIINLTKNTVSKSFFDYSDLTTTINLDKSDKLLRPEIKSPYIIVTEKGDYLSVFEVFGNYKAFDEKTSVSKSDSVHDKSTWQGFIWRLSDSLNTEYKKVGHKLSFIFERDPEAGKDELEKLFEPQFKSIQRTGIDLSDIIQEKIDKLTPFIVRERLYLVVYTSKYSLSKAERLDEATNLAKLASKTPKTIYGQNPNLCVLEGLKIRHDSFLNLVEQKFSDNGCGIILQLMDAHEVGHSLKEEIDRYGTSKNWHPTLHTDNYYPQGIVKNNDYSKFTIPNLKYQIFDQKIETSGDLCIVNNELIHGSISITLGPQQLQPFSELFNQIPRTIPYRVKMDIAPNGLTSLSIKKTILSILGWVPAVNHIWESIDHLSNIDKSDPVCSMTIIFSTWGKNKLEVNRNLTILQKSIQSWGVCSTTRLFGDPIKAWTSTLLAASSSGVRNLLFPPLAHALYLLPLQRPASPWKNDASLVWQTLDGKAFPVKLASSLQTKFTELVVGEPGSGKSIILNMLSEIMISNAQKNLPFISMIDKGYGGQGLVRLIKDALPPERKNEVVGIILENNDKFCKNPFDIQLGAKYPLSYEETYITQILYALCIDPTLGESPNTKDTYGIIQRIIREVYKKNDEYPEQYTQGLVNEVDKVLLELEITEEWLEHASWYDVRDIIFKNKKILEAQLAQYQAVPDLNSAISMLNDVNIKSAFGTIQRENSNELLLEYISRCLIQARDSFRILSSRTKFKINPNTRIIAIDLNNVMGDKGTKTGQLTSGIMYLFAGFISGGDYLLPQYSDELLSITDPVYHTLHLERIEQLDQEIKTKVYDELHNAKDIPFIFESLETQDREQRKFGIRTVLSSQYISDYPLPLLKSANSLYIMKLKSEDIDLLKTNFDVPDFILNKFSSMPAGAALDGSGTSFLAIFRTVSQTIVQILKNTLGAKELWALNSNPIDSALRDKLYEELSGIEARKILASQFPNGSAAKYIEFLKKENVDDENIINSLAKNLIDESFKTEFTRE